MRRAPQVTLACLLATLTVPAHAAVIIQQSPSFVQPDEEVQLDTDLVPGDNTLRGTTNQTDSTVLFQSGSDNLASPPQGQARIEPLDTDGLGQLTFSLENGGTFTSAEFNILAAIAGPITISAFTLQGDLIGSLTNPLNALVGDSGQNFFGILADQSTPIGSVSIAAKGATQISSIGQFRLGGVTGPIPEPATWAMMLISFGFLGAAMRRRKLPYASVRVRYA